MWTLASGRFVKDGRTGRIMVCVIWIMENGIWIMELVEKCYARESPFLSSHERSQCGNCGGKLNTRPGWRGRNTAVLFAQGKPAVFAPTLLVLYSTFRRSYTTLTLLIPR